MVRSKRQHLHTKLFFLPAYLLCYQIIVHPGGVQSFLWYPCSYYIGKLFFFSIKSMCPIWDNGKCVVLFISNLFFKNIYTAWDIAVTVFIELTVYDMYRFFNSFEFSE